MGNGNSTTKEPTTPSRNGFSFPFNPKLGSPARTQMTPSRKRQGGVEISPGSRNRGVVVSRKALAETDDHDYIVDKKNQVGEGSFATVCLGSKVSTGEKLAVKVICKEKIPSPEMKQLIESEFGIIRKLNHRNVISVEHTMEDEENIYIFMPYYSGGDLHSFIDEYDYLAEKVAYKIFFQLVSAVSHCHNNDVIHRDIKLENMMMDNPDDMNVMLIDFGFSVERKPTDPLLNDFPGSPAYAAPELMQAIPYPGYSSDIWAMGIVLYILVTGEYPFWSDNRREMYEQIIGLELDFTLYPHVSASCCDLIKSMLNKDWRKRPTIELIRAHPWFQELKHLQKPAVRRCSSVDERASGERKTPKTPTTNPQPTPKNGNKWTPKVTWKKRKLVF